MSPSTNPGSLALSFAALLFAVVDLAAQPTSTETRIQVTLPDSIRALSHDAIENWKADARGRIIRDRRDPEPRIELGYLYLEQGAAAMARTYFAEALRFDRRSAAAEIGLFRTARAEGREEEAREHLERAAAMAPERATEIRGLADAPPRVPIDPSGRGALRAAMGLLADGEVEAGTEAYLRALDSAGEEALAEHAADLLAFLPEHQVERALEHPGDRGRAIKDLWMGRDPTPATPGNEVLAEAFRRLRQVRREFSSVRPPGYDDRGGIWLRLGPPDRRVPGGGWVLHPAETWLYERVGGKRLVLPFVRRGMEYELVTSLTEMIPVSVWRDLVDPTRGDCRPRPGENAAERARAQDPLHRETVRALLDLAELDPVYMAMAHCLETGGRIIGADMSRESFRIATSLGVARSTFQVEHAYDGEPADFAVRPLAFERPGGAYDVWVVLGHPVGELIGPERAELVLRRAATLYDADWERIDGAAGEVRVAAATLAGGDALVEGFELVALAGAHHLGVQVEETGSRRTGAYWLALDLPPVDRARLRVSDLALADRVLPGDGGRFSRGGLRIVPSPTGVFPASRPVGLYFEIYPPDRVGAGDYRVAVTVRSSRSETVPARIFGAIERALGTREEPGAVTVEYERRIEGPAAVAESLSIDASALPPGTYEVGIRVSGGGMEAVAGASVILSE